MTAADSSRRGAPSRGRRPFLEQSAILQRDQLRQDTLLATATNLTVTVTPLSFLYCPSDPGDHIDDASLGNTVDATTSYGTCDGDWYVWSVNWGATNYGRPHESFAVRPELRAQDRDRSPTGPATR